MSIAVVQSAENPVEPQVLAEAIVTISEGFRRLEKSGLNKRAIIILMQDATGLSQKTLRTVLDELPRLANRYTRLT